jgi:hypothetical protein
MKIARPKKVEIQLTVLIVISLILSTACGTQPTVEPAPVSTVVLIQPASSLTPTNTPEAPLPSETPTPEAAMTVEQQKAYLEAHKIPYIVKANGELQFDFMKMFTETASIKVGHQETLGADLAAAAAEYDIAFPEPTSSNPADFYSARWYSATSKEQQTTLYAINIISNDFAEKNKLIEPIGAVLADIDGEQYAFMYMRALLTDPIEIAKNDGNAFVTFWIMDASSTYTKASSTPEATLQRINEGQMNFSFFTITGTTSELTNTSHDELHNDLLLFAKDRAWHLQNANLDSTSEMLTIQPSPDSMLVRLINQQGFSAGMQDGIFLGAPVRPTDVLDRSFVDGIEIPTNSP